MCALGQISAEGLGSGAGAGPVVCGDRSSVAFLVPRPFLSAFSSSGCG